MGWSQEGAWPWRQQSRLGSPFPETVVRGGGKQAGLEEGPDPCSMAVSFPNGQVLSLWAGKGPAPVQAGVLSLGALSGSKRL